MGGTGRSTGSGKPVEAAMAAGRACSVVAQSDLACGRKPVALLADRRDEPFCIRCVIDPAGQDVGRSHGQVPREGL
jgi:hypothetical protein